MLKMISLMFATLISGRDERTASEPPQHRANTCYYSNKIPGHQRPQCLVTEQ